MVTPGCNRKRQERRKDKSRREHESGRTDGKTHDTQNFHGDEGIAEIN
jgi:hypothetical protein